MTGEKDSGFSRAPDAMHDPNCFALLHERESFPDRVLQRHEGHVCRTGSYPFPAAVNLQRKLLLDKSIGALKARSERRKGCPT